MTTLFNSIKEMLSTSSTSSTEIDQEPESALGSVYNHYPGDRNQYPKGTPSGNPFPKQDFQEYAVGQVIAKSSAKNDLDNIIVTSGTLTCRNNDGVRDAYTTNYNFRMLMNPMNIGLVRVGYTDFRVTTLGTVMKWHTGLPNWAGMHIFARYQTSNDLYVASYRVDGYVTLKKKVAAKYTTIKQLKIGAPKINKEYVLSLECEGNALRFFIDGNLILEGTDGDLGWGTIGVRMDYSDSYIDYIKVSDV